MTPTQSHWRRPTWSVAVGVTSIGGQAPVVLQSMTSTPTMDTEASVDQALRIAAAGGEIVRLTAPGSREAANIGEIRRELRRKGCDAAIVADIHFNPAAALTAAACCDKVRINPGNFVDPGRTFKKIDFTPEEYDAEIKKIDRALKPLLDICKEHSTALRIGVNHGSLSDRIMSRYGDTPAGMAESAMEFLRVCVANDFRNVVISIKASNVRVMVETTRRLTAAMAAEGMQFPLHLGVTEAGDGEDARIKSAVGIGSLLAEGIGDTVRVSLSEPPENEIPVARAIVDYATSTVSPLASAELRRNRAASDLEWFMPTRRRSSEADGIGGKHQPVVASAGEPRGCDPDRTPDFLIGADTPVIAVDSSRAAGTDAAGYAASLLDAVAAADDRAIVLSGNGVNSPEAMTALVRLMDEKGMTNPVILHMDYPDTTDRDAVTLKASIDLGRMLLDGIGDGLMVTSPALSDAEAANLAFGILQSTRLRMTRTEYIACPGCGRTLYDLQSTLRDIKEATAGLRGLKIGVMGCIVNGPGEMADADYGYVGAGPGRVSLYKGKECVVKNIPTEEAVERLLALIRENGDWK